MLCLWVSVGLGLAAGAGQELGGVVASLAFPWGRRLGLPWAWLTAVVAGVAAFLSFLGLFVLAFVGSVAAVFEGILVAFEGKVVVAFALEVSPQMPAPLGLQTEQQELVSGVNLCGL